MKFLRSEGDKYNPRLIILALMDNDFSDNIRERLFELTPDNKLQELPIPPKCPSRRLQEIIETVPGLANTYLVGLARQVSLELFPRYRRVADDSPTEPVDAREDQLTYKILEETLALTRGKGWPVFGITIEIEGQRLDSLNRIFELYDVPRITIPGKQARPEFYYPTLPR